MITRQCSSREARKMVLEFYTNPEEFLNITRSYLMQNEAENNLLLGVLAAAIAGDYKENLPLMAIYQDESHPELVMMCTPPYPVVFAYQDTLPDKERIEQVLLGLSGHLGNEFTGVTANKILSKYMVDIWEQIKGVDSKVTTAMRIYKLDRVNPVQGVPGRLRTIQPADQSLLRQWLVEYTREALSEEPDKLRIQKRIDQYLTAEPDQRGLMLWEANGNPVSMAGYSGPTPNGIRVGMIYTPENQRCSGYASACTAAVSQSVLDLKFKFCFLYTDRHNPITNKIYQRIGYQPICDVDRYDFVR